MGEEPTQWYTYDRQVELSDAYKKKAEQLEQQGADQLSIPQSRMWRMWDWVVRVIGGVIVVALILAVAAVCFWVVSAFL